MKKVFLLSIYSIFLCMLFSVQAHANLIVNGSFENPASGYSTPLMDSYVTLSGPTHALQGWDITQYRVAWETMNHVASMTTGMNSNDPNLVINLSAYWFEGTIAQTFATTANANYLVSFFVASPLRINFDNQSLHSDLEVSIDGVTSSFDIAPSQTLSSRSFTFTANDNSTTIAFKSPAGGYWSPVIDDVSVDELVSPVPEPATMLLLGSGLIGLAGFRKRFFKK
jgi:hypothetical protein